MSTVQTRGHLINAWYRCGTVAANIFFLNLLWFVCSLPLVTLPPSTAAVFATVSRWSRGEEGVAGTFFREWKRLLWKSYALCLPALAVAGVLAAEIAYYLPRRDGMSLAMLGMAVGFSLVFLSIAAYLLPVLASYSLGARDCIRVAVFLGVRRIGPTLAAILPLWLAAVLLVLWMPAALAFGVVPAAAWLTQRAAAKGLSRLEM